MLIGFPRRVLMANTCTVSITGEFDRDSTLVANSAYDCSFFYLFSNMGGDFGLQEASIFFFLKILRAEKDCGHTGAGTLPWGELRR